MPTAASRRSSWSSSALAAAVLVLLAAGCGGSGAKQQRAQVNAYFAAVNRAEAPVRNDGTAIATALRGFSLDRVTPSEVSALQQAERDFGNTLAALSDVTVPEAARPLHAHLTALLARQRELTRELIATERYLPRFAQAVGLLPAAGRQLANGLAALGRVKRQTVPQAMKGYAAVFAAYQASLETTLTRLEALQAPAVLRPYLTGEEATLRRRIVLCATVTSALAKRDVATANAAIHSLLSPAPSAAAAGAAAARAYDARVAQVARLARQVAQDRNRLVRLVG
jgi:hypothetical protein